jgi:AcrR family transcriptional regulator
LDLINIRAEGQICCGFSPFAPPPRPARQRPINFTEVLVLNTDSQNPTPGFAQQSMRDGALILFSDQGYAAVSLRTLASSVGVQVGALYHHFDGKQALLFDLIEEYEEALADTLDQAVSTGRCSLATYLENYIRFVLLHPREAQLATQELRHLSFDQQRHIEDIRWRYRIPLWQWVRTHTSCDDTRALVVYGVLAFVAGLPSWPGARQQAATEHQVMVFKEMALGMFDTARYKAP